VVSLAQTSHFANAEDYSVMNLLPLVAIQFACAAAWSTLRKPPGLVAAQLRGMGKPAAAASSSKEATKKVVDDRGEHGHFYYAEKCEDCVYKNAQCGCEPAMEYMACLTKHCYASNHTDFADKCTALSSQCYQEIEVDCRGPQTACHSKFHQMPVGGMGLNVEVDEDEALCGPFGKCIGQLHMKATVTHAKSLSVASKAIPSSPAPAVASSPASGPVAAPAPAVAPAAIWLECGLPNKKKADFDNKDDWDNCQAEVENDEAECDLPLPDDWLKAAETAKAYCVLKGGEDGERLTQPSWHSILNVHQNGKKAVAEPEEEEKKPKKAKKETKKPKKTKKADKAKKAEAPRRQRHPRPRRTPLTTAASFLG